MLLLVLAAPGFAKTHKDVFDVPCNILWPAVKDTLRNSGKYGIIGIDNSEMTASYNMGGNLTGKRINSIVLNSSGNGCEMQVQTAFSGLVNNDVGDMKKRVQESLEKLQAAGPEKPKVTAYTTVGDSAAAAALPKLSGNALTNSDILSLKQAGISDQLIIEKIQSSPAKFSLETNDLVALKQAGIADTVVSAMIEASKRP
jgi:hypothetical protein